MYEFTPLDKHYDNGFGAVADSFKDAASELETQHHRVKINGHLPICYLYRHSIELFLKGIIIIIHQGLKLPYGSQPYFSEPKIPVHGKPSPVTIYWIHDIGSLYGYVSSLFFENKLNEVTGLSEVFTVEFSSKIDRLNDIDPMSSYFRYPTNSSKNFEKDKSAFKETTYEDVMALAIKKQRSMAATRTVKLVGRDAQVFVHDDSFTAEVMSTLSDVAEEVSACHFALMNEFGCGY